MNHRSHRRKQRRRATAALEFAVIAPVLFLFSFAGLEFMRVGMLQSQADVASYEAARAVIVPGAKKHEAVAEAEKYLNYLGSREKTIHVEPTDARCQRSQSP